MNNPFSFKTWVYIILGIVFLGIVILAGIRYYYCSRASAAAASPKAADPLSTAASEEEVNNASSSSVRTKAYSVAAAGLTGIRNWFQTQRAKQPAQKTSLLSGLHPSTYSEIMRIFVSGFAPIPQTQKSNLNTPRDPERAAAAAAAVSKAPAQAAAAQAATATPASQAAPAPPAAPKNRSSFQKIGHEAFVELVECFGGKREDVKENVRCQDIINPETGRRLEFDSFYEDRTYRIAVEYQGAHHTQYPNIYHRSLHEHEAQKRRDVYKAEAALRNGVVLICVPYEIDRHVRDAREPTGWRFDPSITDVERKRRISEFLSQALVDAAAQKARPVAPSGAGASLPTPPPPPTPRCGVACS